MSTFTIFFGVIVIAATLLMLYVAYYLLVRKGKLSFDDKKRLLDHWDLIKMQGYKESAIIGADKVLDEILRLYGYKGSLGEKLKSSEKLFSDYQGIWEAHKLRNMLAHEIEAVFTSAQAEKALKQFERAFRDLGLFR